MAYSSVYNFHAYDALGQLQTTAMYRGTPPASGAPASGDELPGRRFEYRYDNSGNRKSAGPTGNASGVDDVYTLKSNGLNQYVTKENNTVRILGTVNATSSVTAQGPAGAIAVTKRDRNFAGDLAPANTSGPAKGDVTITASSNDSPPVVDSDTRSWQIAPRNQSFDYDADGNLWKDNVWEYTYDAENRLIRMASLLPTGQGFKRLQLDFVYD